jgi:hypothetical protein
VKAITMGKYESRKGIGLTLDIVLMLLLFADNMAMVVTIFINIMLLIGIRG